MTKKILKYTSVALAIATIILSIVNLVFYYSYANILSEIQNGGLNEIAKFELQESKNLYLYRTLALVPWTCVVAIITTIISTISLLMNSKPNNNYVKIR